MTKYIKPLIVRIVTTSMWASVRTDADTRQVEDRACDDVSISDADLLPVLQTKLISNQASHTDASHDKLQAKKTCSTAV